MWLSLVRSSLCLLGLQAHWSLFPSPPSDECPMTNRPEDFDFDAALQSLAASSKKVPEEEREAIKLAAQALHFLFAENRLHEFRRYLSEATQPAVDVVRIEHEFADMTQASKWLTAEPPPRHGTLVKVAGRTHTVWRDEDGSLLLLPSFSPQDLEARRK